MTDETYGAYLTVPNPKDGITIWASSGPEEFGCAFLTPTQARSFAVELLQLAAAAETAEVPQ